MSDSADEKRDVDGPWASSGCWDTAVGANWYCRSQRRAQMIHNQRSGPATEGRTRQPSTVGRSASDACPGRAEQTPSAPPLPTAAVLVRADDDGTISRPTATHGQENPRTPSALNRSEREMWTDREGRVSAADPVGGHSGRRRIVRVGSSSLARLALGRSGPTVGVVVG